MFEKHIYKLYKLETKLSGKVAEVYLYYSSIIGFIAGVIYACIDLRISLFTIKKITIYETLENSPYTISCMIMKKIDECELMFSPNRLIEMLDSEPYDRNIPILCCGFRMGKHEMRHVWQTIHNPELMKQEDEHIDPDFQLTEWDADSYAFSDEPILKDVEALKRAKYDDTWWHYIFKEDGLEAPPPH